VSLKKSSFEESAWLSRRPWWLRVTGLVSHYGANESELRMEAKVMFKGEERCEIGSRMSNFHTLALFVSGLINY
jgi:hypothetical protein